MIPPRALSPVLLLVLLCLIVGTPLAPAASKPKPAAPDYSRYYNIEKISTPLGFDPQVGGLTFLPNGKLAVCFHRGEVALYDPDSKEWSIFARGLHEPLGIIAESDHSLVIMQRPELTRLIDEDHDGVADRFETICDDFGMTGNYHEFAFGPVRDPEGNFVVSLNVASNGASIREEIRGDWNNIGLPREDFYVDGEWKKSKSKGKAGRMYSRVPYRGWVVKIHPETGELTPWASGFRSPNGLGYDAENRLFVTDNQGDWLGTSKLHHVQEGGFHGHPASLIWREGWTQDPLTMPVAELDKLRTRAAVLFTHDTIANSPTQPLLIPPGTLFTPFEGQMLVGEMNRSRIIRLALEEVAGTVQGACIFLLDGSPLHQGNNRLAFDKDGALWVGQTHLSWAGGQGIQKITPTGETPPVVHHINLTEKGFKLTFTQPLDPELATDPDTYPVSSYYFEYRSKYGSDQMDKSKSTPSAVTLSDDHRIVDLTLPELKAGYVYQFDLSQLATADGDPLLSPVVTYTVNHLADGTTPSPQTSSHRIRNAVLLTSSLAGASALLFLLIHKPFHAS
jgi:glucose/arabinose dehydrogenase